MGEGSNDYAQYTTYRLPTDAEYEVASAIRSQDLVFGNVVKLTGLSYGHVAADPQEPGAALEDNTLPSGQPAWVVLRWQALEPIANDLLKVSLFLTDETGNLAGQVDDRLFGDLYLIDFSGRRANPQAVTTSCLRFQPFHQVATRSTSPSTTATRSSVTRLSIPPQARSPLQPAWVRSRSRARLPRPSSRPRYLCRQPTSRMP